MKSIGKFVPGELYRKREWVNIASSWYAYEAKYLLVRVCEDIHNFGEFLTPEETVERMPLVYFITETEFDSYVREGKVIK